jgi:RNA polymerase sigma factor (TIGR02999 family)
LCKNQAGNLAMSEVTRILTAIEQGNSKAVDELLPAVYQELRALAAHKLKREAPGQALQPTTLVHEAYLRLVGADVETYKGRSHFFVAAAKAMRRILIENARRKQSLKREGGQQKGDLDETVMVFDETSEDLLALDEALDKLVKKEPVIAELVNLRYFAGLTLEQAAMILNVTQRTVERYWAYARAWLYHEISEGDTGTPG